MIELRRAEAALSVGELAPLPPEESFLAYIRKAGARRLLVVLNLRPEPSRFALSELRCAARVLLSTHMDRIDEEEKSSLELRADEGVICALT